MKVPKALRRELSHVDDRNWRSKLDALKTEEGTWKGVAERLGTDRRTVERWRYGYTDRRGTRRQVGKDTISKHAAPKISKALGASKKAQLRAVDWSRLSVKGTLWISEGEHEENMYLGEYFEDDDFERIGQAYLTGDDAAVQSAFNQAVANSYIGDGASALTDVSWLRF